jgi:hypothetical protein
MGQYLSDERENYIRKIRAAQLLDSVFLLFYFNGWKRHWGPPLERPPRIELSEVLPGLSQATYEHTLPSVQRMWKDADAVALAYFKYPQAKRTYEEELTAFKANNPGFSEKAYELAIDAHLVELR